MNMPIMARIFDIARIIQMVSSISVPGLKNLWALIGWKRLLWGLGAALVALVIAFGVITHGQKKAAQRALEAAQIEVAVLRAERAGNAAAQDVINVERPRVAREYADRRAETEKALEANSEWANEPIPSDVLASIVRD